MKKNPIVPVTAIVIFGAILIYLIHREKQRPDSDLTVNPAFRVYVQAFTSGVVSTHSMILVRLAENFTDSATPGTRANDDWMQITPSVKGKLTWLDSRTLAFRPESPLPPGKRFQVDLFLSKMLNVPDSLSTLTFQFTTMTQLIEVKTVNHVAVSPADLTREVLSGVLFTSDEADNELILKTLEATQGGRVLPVSWDHNAANRQHRFRVDSIVRGKTEERVVLTWDGEEIGSESKGSLETIIPALGDFKVLSLSSEEGDLPTLIVQFSDPPDPTQNLDGLFRVGKYGSLRYAVEENRLKIFLPDRDQNELNVTVEPSVRSVSQALLGKKFTQSIRQEDNRPNVRFVGDGTIMPSGNGMLLPFEAVNLNAVDIKVVRIYEKNILQFLQVNDLPENRELVRVGRIVLQKTLPLTGVANKGNWNRWSIDLSKLIKAEPGALYSVILRFRQPYACTGNNGELGKDETGLNLIQLTDPETENEKEWGWYSDYQDNDFDNYGWRHYRWEDREDPTKASYYYNKSVSRNVLASDLGIITKAGGDGNWHVYVTDIATAKPLSGIPVEIFNFQLQPIASAETNREGMAKISLKKIPFVVVARHGKQSGYLKLQDGKSLSLSMFDVGGEPIRNGVKGFIYGERGVWRPGDSIFLSFMMENKSAGLPVNHPVTLSLISPSGQVMQKMVKTNGLNGLYRFPTATAWDAPTGNWLAIVNVGNTEFRKTIKIETVKPNRLKITFGFGTDRLVREQIPEATLNARWLTGATAGHLKATVSLTLSRSVTNFQQFPGFVFDNPTVGFAPENITIFDGRLDQTGTTLIKPSIHVEHVAPGALKASFETIVFEDGGDFSSDRFSIPYFPYLTYVGLKTPELERGSKLLYTDKSYPISLVNVDANGLPVRTGKVKVEVFKLDWRWWWDDTDQGDANFISTAYNRIVDSATITLSGGKGIYNFQAAHDDWGRYLIKLTDLASGHASGQILYADWPGYFRIPGGEKQAAAMLTLTADKKSYKVGDKVTLTIPTSPDGRALVTLENGTTVLQSFWVPTQKGSTRIRFDATEQMSPNCYAYVTLLQPHAQSVNDLPVRLYGVIPVLVENPASHLMPVITMPHELAPGKEAAIMVKEEKGHAMTYTLAVVDDGLLDLTRFKTPDPWSIFYAREALGVKTWDLYDNVMGANSGELQRILSIGGDQEAISRDGLKANRFKAMVKFLGPFSIQKGEIKTHKFIMPEYIGSVRVMVVAGQDGRYGSAEKSVPVKKALMVLGTLPRVLGPGETVSLPVTVFALDPKIKKVNVTIEPGELFTIKGAKAQSVTFTGAGDQLVPFTISVARQTGIGKIRIIATSGNEKAEHQIEIGIRNPNPPITNITDQEIAPGQSWNVEVTAPGIAGSNKGYLELSALPSMNLEKRLDHLIHYPYGCLEQTVSSVFPQLFLKNLIALTVNEEKRTEKNVISAINRLKSFQHSNGGFGYWPQASYADDWATNYAGHFLLMADLNGFSIPSGMLSKWKEFQRQKAISWSYNAGYTNDELVQAYRLYTLALARAPESGALNRLLEKRDLSPGARWRLASAYFLTGKKEISLQLIKGVPVDVKSYNEMGGSFGSDLRDKAMILQTLVQLDLRTQANPLAREIMVALGQNDLRSTQEISFGLMAVAEYTGNREASGISATIQQGTEAATALKSDKPVAVHAVNVTPGMKSALAVKNTGKGLLFARLVTSGIPAPGEGTESSQNLKLSVLYKDMKGTIISPILLKQGTSFTAEVTVTNPGLYGLYENLALSQIFPSGWEIINARSSDLALAKAGDGTFDYQDIRDDRANTFFSLEAGRSKTFKILLMATYNGRFYQPAVRCSAMYDASVEARTTGRWVEVVK